MTKRFDFNVAMSAAQRWRRWLDRDTARRILCGELDPVTVPPQVLARIFGSTSQQERCAMLAEALAVVVGGETGAETKVAPDARLVALKRAHPAKSRWWHPLDLLDQFLEQPAPALLSSVEPSPEGLGWAAVAERTVGVRRPAGWSSGTLFAPRSADFPALIVIEGGCQAEEVLVRFRSGGEGTARPVRTMSLGLGGIGSVDLTLLALSSHPPSPVVAWTRVDASETGEVWVCALGGRLSAGELCSIDGPVFRSTCVVGAGFGGGPTCNANQSLIGLTIGGGADCGAHLAVSSLLELLPELA